MIPIPSDVLPIVDAPAYDNACRAAQIIVQAEGFAAHVESVTLRLAETASSGDFMLRRYAFIIPFLGEKRLTKTAPVHQISSFVRANDNY